MSYIDKDLLTGERVVYRGKLHWFIFLPGIFWSVAAIVLFILSHQNPLFSIVAVIALLCAVYMVSKGFIVRASTELAVTNKRIIFKQGLISRSTMELNHAKIESIREDQTVMGRMFDCGTLVIEGTGGGKEYLQNIDAPLEFKKQAQSAADQAVAGNVKS
jgi:uncharacterized membrane protein YdbT with pleckstrin-like domain